MGVYFRVGPARGNGSIPLSSTALKYKLVIFDSDGTLADTLPWAGSIFNDLARAHRFRILEPHEFDLYRNLSHRELFVKLGLPLRKLPAVIKAFRLKMAEHANELKPFPGIHEMLMRLASAGVQLGVVSSNSTDNVRTILGPPSAALILQYRCGASIFGKASKLRAVLKASGIPPRNSLYVGDELRDLEAARSAGMAFGAVTWGQHEPSLFARHHPEELFTTVSQIADTVVGDQLSARDRVNSE